MRERLILKSQANQVLQAIQAKELDGSEFERGQRESLFQQSGLIVSVLIHRPSGYYYLFDFRDGKHFAEYSPGPDSPVRRENPGGWGSQISYVRQWLDHLKREVEAPDLWAALSQEKALVGAAAGQVGNDPFTPEQVN
jgi:hypothetical protein